MPERIQLNTADPTSLQEAVVRAREVLEGGGVILYPTDTVYGLGADALNGATIERVNHIKGRGPDKRMIILVSDMPMAQHYTVWNDSVQALAKAFWPGPLTIELEQMPALPDALTGGVRRGGVRMPDHTFCRDLVRALGRPITSTSANPTGVPQENTVDAILQSLGARADEIGLVIEEVGISNKQKLPSTLVSINPDGVHIIREGSISRAHIEDTGIACIG